MINQNKIHCDGCSKSIELGATDTVNALLAEHGWEHDPLSTEYQYCDKCLHKIKPTVTELKVTRP